MHIESIIDNINLKNGFTFDKSNIQSLQNFINSFEVIHKLEYLDHGGSCICFRIPTTDNILKIYKKSNNSILRSSIIFQDYINNLNRLNIPIITTNIIYEDTFYIIAIQPFITTFNIINPYIAKKILNIVEIMLLNRTRLHDIYFRNFGFLNNKLYLFDFHESINFYDNIDLFTTNLLQLFALLFNNQLAFNMINPNITLLINSNYCTDILPNIYSDFLRTIHQFKINEAIEILQNLIYPDLGKLISKSFSNYQHYIINNDGKLILKSHTLQKALIAENIAKIVKPISILDPGCSYGAIGIYLKTIYPHIDITLNNLDNNELTEAYNMANWIGCYGIKYINKNFMDIPLVKYDLTLCYALVHHILRTYTIDEFLIFIKILTKKIAIIEFPLKGDILLDQVIASTNQPTQYLWENRYRCLSDIAMLRTKLSEYGNIVDVIEMNYEQNGLKRFSFVLSF